MISLHMAHFRYRHLVKWQQPLQCKRKHKLGLRHKYKPIMSNVNVI